MVKSNARMYRELISISWAVTFRPMVAMVVCCVPMAMIRRFKEYSAS